MLAFNFHPFPVIKTPRLTLREFALSDFDGLFKIRNDADAMKYIGKPFPASVDDVKGLLNRMIEGVRMNTAITWAVTLNDNNELIGHIGYHLVDRDHYRAEIGYLLASQYWRRGIMSEAIGEVLKYGFEIMKLHSVEAKVDPVNEKSKGILKKFNFISEGYFKENFFFNGKFLDTEVFSLLADKL